MWLWLRMMPATRWPTKENNTYQAKPSQVELWIVDWFETLTKAKELNSLAGVFLAMFYIRWGGGEREVIIFVKISTSSQTDRPASSAIDEKMIKVEVLDNISKMWSPLNLPARTWSKKNLIKAIDILPDFLSRIWNSIHPATVWHKIIVSGQRSF